MSRKNQSVAVKRQIGTFKQKAYDLLMEIGAQETECSNVYLLETLYGDLNVKINEDWLQCVFAEPKRAPDQIQRSERFHPHNGKWIWSGQDCLFMFKNAVTRLMEERLNISIDKKLFNDRKDRFMAEYGKVKDSTAGKQFLRIVDELNVMSNSCRNISIKAAELFAAPPAKKIEALFRDIFPVLEKYKFPAHGTPELSEALHEIKVVVWLK